MRKFSLIAATAALSIFAVAASPALADSNSCQKQLAANAGQGTNGSEQHIKQKNSLATFFCPGVDQFQLGVNYTQGNGANQTVNQSQKGLIFFGGSYNTGVQTQLGLNLNGDGSDNTQKVTQKQKAVIGSANGNAQTQGAVNLVTGSEGGNNSQKTNQSQKLGAGQTNGTVQSQGAANIITGDSSDNTQTINQSQKMVTLGGGGNNNQNSY